MDQTPQIKRVKITYVTRRELISHKFILAPEILFMEELKPFGPVKEAISNFADARQHSGHPVSIRWGGDIRS
jgi:hypothetical protein